MQKNNFSIILKCSTESRAGCGTIPASKLISELDIAKRYQRLEGEDVVVATRLMATGGYFEEIST